MEAGEETTLNSSGAVNENTYMNSSLIQLVTTTDENMTSVNTSEAELILPDDMQFNTSSVISIVGYSILFVVSSIANCSVLMILIRRYKKTKSRVNLLLIHLAIAGKIHF